MTAMVICVYGQQSINGHWQYFVHCNGVRKRRANMFGSQIKIRKSTMTGLGNMVLWPTKDQWQVAIL